MKTVRRSSRLFALLFVTTVLVLPVQGAGRTTPSGSPITDIAISEVYYLGTAGNDYIELTNTGIGLIDVTNWWVCARFNYAQLSTLTPIAGDYTLNPGESVAFTVTFDLNDASSDIGIYDTNSFASAANMADFVQYGTSANVGRSNVAVTKGIWTETAATVYDFVVTAGGADALHWLGTNSGGGLTTLSSDFNNAPQDPVPVELIGFTVD